MLPDKRNKITGPDHGAFSAVIVRTRADDIFKAMYEAYPWIEACDIVAVEQYCRAEAKARLLSEHVMDMLETVENWKGLSPSVITASTKADETAMRAAAAIGLSPEGRMRIAKDAGFAQVMASQSVSQLQAQGAAIRKNR